MRRATAALSLPIWTTASSSISRSASVAAFTTLEVGTSGGQGKGAKLEVELLASLFGCLHSRFYPNQPGRTDGPILKPSKTNRTSASLSNTSQPTVPQPNPTQPSPMQYTLASSPHLIFLGRSELFVPSAISWGLEVIRYSLSRLWGLTIVSQPLLFGHDAQAYLDNALSRLPKTLSRRLKYFRAFVATPQVTL